MKKSVRKSLFNFYHFKLLEDDDDLRHKPNIMLKNDLNPFVLQISNYFFSSIFHLQLFKYDWVKVERIVTFVNESQRNFTLLIILQHFADYSHKTIKLLVLVDFKIRIYTFPRIPYTHAFL